MFVYCFYVSIVLISVLLQEVANNFYFYNSLFKKGSHFCSQLCVFSTKGHKIWESGPQNDNKD